MRSGLLSFVLLIPFLGCGAATTTPETTLRDYARALRDGQPDDAYALLSADAKRGVSRDQFAELLRSDPEGARQLGQALANPSAPASQTARITSQSGQEVELVFERGRWLLAGAAVDLYAQDSPRHAVHAFLRAVLAKRYDVVMRFVPLQHAAGLSPEQIRASWEGAEREELLSTLHAISRALPSARIERSGDVATMDYGEGTLSLRLEEGAWKIEDFN